MSDLFRDLPEGWPLLIGAALFAILIAESVYVLLFRAKEYRKNVNRRLELQQATGNRESALIQLKRERGLIDAEGNATMGKLMQLIQQSGIGIGVRNIAIAWAACALLAPVAAFALGHGEPLKLLGAIAVGAVLPLFILKTIRDRRIKKFSEQFPDAIDIVVRSLKAGHPLPIAISLVAREMPDPVGTEFGVVSDELSFGLDLESAMRNMAQRVGQEDLPLFTTSIAIQATTGGNLASILEGLSKLIRDRFKMRRKIKAISSEARMSATVLLCLPFAIFVMVSAADPTYFDEARGKPLTTMVIIGSLCWMSIGVLVMRKMVNMKI
jgi:tight adherence protein B